MRRRRGMARSGRCPISPGAVATVTAAHRCRSCPRRRTCRGPHRRSGCCRSRGGGSGAERQWAPRTCTGRASRHAAQAARSRAPSPPRGAGAQVLTSWRCRAGTCRPWCWQTGRSSCSRRRWWRPGSRCCAARQGRGERLDGMRGARPDCAIAPAAAPCAHQSGVQGLQAPAASGNVPWSHSVHLLASPSHCAGHASSGAALVCSAAAGGAGRKGCRSAKAALLTVRQLGSVHSTHSPPTRPWPRPQAVQVPAAAAGRHGEGQGSAAAQWRHPARMALP